MRTDAYNPPYTAATVSSGLTLAQARRGRTIAEIEEWEHIKRAALPELVETHDAVALDVPDALDAALRAAYAALDAPVEAQRQAVARAYRRECSAARMAFFDHEIDAGTSHERQWRAGRERDKALAALPQTQGVPWADVQARVAAVAERAIRAEWQRIVDEAQSALAAQGE